MTTTTLRPNGTVQDTGTLTGATPASTALSDNSDASYDTLTAGQLVLVDMTTQALPALAVAKTLTVRLRGVETASPRTVYGDIFGAGGSLINSWSTIVGTGAMSTYSAVTLAYSGSQTDIDALQVRVYRAAGSGGSSLQLAEVYLDLTYALAPTVAVTGPTGVQATPTPSITWTYTQNSDGDVQSRYQIRVFTAAQYGIGGFDPATSPASYDSGVVLGSASAATLGVLPNSSTMRAYMSVAQVINGTPQWSAWQSSGFTTSFTTSDITSVAATADNVNGRIALVVTRNTGTPTWTNLDVQRSDDGGTTWNYLRGANSAPVTTSPASLNDYESANGVTVQYRARAGYTLSGVYIVGAWVTSSTLAWSMAADWLKDVHYTARNRQVRVKVQPTLTRPRPQGINQVIGRSDPVVVSDVRGLRRGQLTFQTQTDAEAVDMLALLANDVLLLQTQPTNRFGQAYVAIGDVTEAPLQGLEQIANAWARLFTVTFTEVLKPIDTGIV